MLHKSRSNTKKQWRYLLVLPLLAGLLMSMNTERIYTQSDIEGIDAKASFDLIKSQSDAEAALHTTTNVIEQKVSSDTKAISTDKEKKSEAQTDRIKTSIATTISSTINDNLNKAQTITTSESATSMGDISITVIDKNTSDSELDKIKNDLKKEGLTVKFKGVKRNSNGEITAIKIDAKSKNSNANYNISSDEPISPVKIVYNIENESISIGNGHRKHGEHTFVYETHEGGDYKIHKSGKGNNVFVITEDIHEDADVDHESRVVIRKNGKHGKTKTIKRTKNVEVISGDDEVIEVIVEGDGNDKGEVIEEIIIVNGKELKTTDEDVEVIVERKGNNNVWVTRSNDDDDEEIVIELDTENNNISMFNGNGKDPLYIIDGKEVSKKEFQKLKPNKIESMTVLKDESAKEKYGDKGKNGVIIVKTKKD